MMSRISSVRGPRSDFLTPVAAYSGGYHPIPAPSTTRLLERNCNVASCLASNTGSRIGMTITEVPSLTRSVTPATKDKAVRGSRKETE